MIHDIVSELVSNTAVTWQMTFKSSNFIAASVHFNLAQSLNVFWDNCSFTDMNTLVQHKLFKMHKIKHTKCLELWGSRSLENEFLVCRFSVNCFEWFGIYLILFHQIQCFPGTTNHVLIIELHFFLWVSKLLLFVRYVIALLTAVLAITDTHTKCDVLKYFSKTSVLLF